ncbi:hypothetical protein AAC387_Pa02g0136 [Persea americana]
MTMLPLAEATEPGNVAFTSLELPELASTSEGRAPESRGFTASCSNVAGVEEVVLDTKRSLQGWGEPARLDMPTGWTAAAESLVEA